MVIFLFTSLLYASDVYEICMIKNQKWVERFQTFETSNTSTFFSTETVQFIVHEKSFEINRDTRPIVDRFEENGMQCIREHKNSKLCYDQKTKKYFWEWNTRAGETFRDVMSICSVNGE
jgi:hypothetical protein